MLTLSSSLAQANDELTLNEKFIYKPSQIKAKDLNKHLKTLSADNLMGRKFASFHSKKAQEYLVSALEQHSIAPFQGQYQHHFNRESLFSSTKQGTNIIGIVKGRSSPDQYIVLTAHYDHLGKSRGKVYNGADDNASGVSALLVYAGKIAKKPLKHSVIFLFTDGEEVNLLGAKAFVKQQKSLLNKIVVNINVDMIAGDKSTKKLHYIHKGLDNIFNSQVLSHFNRFTASNFPIKVKYGFRAKMAGGRNRINWINASDHSAFYREQIPVLYFGVGTHKNYHTPNDTFESVNLDFFFNASQVIFKYIEFIDLNS